MTSLQTIRFLPYPELVEPEPVKKPYTILDSLAVEGLPSTGMVNKEDRLMFVPLDASGSSTIRHELAHVRWSPTKLPKVSHDPLILLATEDARINFALERRGLGVHLGPDLIERVASLAADDLARGDVAAFALRAIASLGTNALPRVFSALGGRPTAAGELTQMLLAEVRARLERSRSLAADKSIATFAGAMRTARFVARQLESRGLAVLPNGALRINLLEGGCCLSCAPPAHAALARLLSRVARDRYGKSGAEDINAAEMIISQPALPVACKARSSAIGGRSRREGSFVRRPNRWFSDRAIFRTSARVSGGTVLIDTSASMKLDAASVEKIVASAPSATLVAIYSGKDRMGELRIVARNGRRVADNGLVPFGGGNLIDLPALNWLAKQARPRLWLSDGRVTGVHDWASSLLMRQCHGVCQRSGIRRVETAEEAAAVLYGHPVPVRSICRERGELMPYFPRTTDRRSLELVRSKADRIASRREFERSLVYPDQFLPVPLRLPHAPTSQTTKRKSIVVPSEAEPGRRIILLSGERRIPRGAFHLEATIFASPKGHASGEILWTNVDSPGVPVDMACPELVRGTADGIYLELAGYHIEPPLISESYRITLYGAEEVGVFQGICCLCGVWDAPLSGTYQIVTAHE